jgi:hypothetical protein
MVPDMKNLPPDYRLSAGQCRQRASAAVNEISKASWLLFAEEWMKLADEAELSAWRAPEIARPAPMTQVCVGLPNGMPAEPGRQ